MEVATAANLLEATVVRLGWGLFTRARREVIRSLRERAEANERRERRGVKVSEVSEVSRVD